MANLREEAVIEIKALAVEGTYLLLAEDRRKRPNTKYPENLVELSKKYVEVVSDYQSWYGRSLRVVISLAAERREEFERLYSGDPKGKELNFLTAGVQHYLRGTRSRRGSGEWEDYYGTFTANMQLQIAILQGIADTAGSRLHSIESALQHVLLLKEIDAATVLRKRKLVRAAGAVAGVAIEQHLKSICTSRKIKIRSNATINDYAETLRAADVVDIPVWRHLQRLADIRNMAVHAKEREPTLQEIDDLISGAKKFIGELS